MQLQNTKESCLNVASESRGIICQILVDISTKFNEIELIQCVHDGPILVLITDVNQNWLVHAFVVYINDISQHWEVCLGVSCTTTSWLVGDISDQSVSFKKGGAKKKKSSLH